MAASKRKSKSTTSTIFSSNENKGCYNQILSMLRHYLKRAYRKLKIKLFGVDYVNRQNNNRRLLRKRRHHPLNNKQHHHSNNKAKLMAPHSNGDVHYHHHHHHHIHHHHLHLCGNGTSHTPKTPPTTNGDVTVGKYMSPDCTHKKMKSIEPYTPDNALSVRESMSKAVVPAQPIVISNDTETEANAPRKSLQMKNTTALIIPDTTVVICHSSSIPGPDQTHQTPMTTLSLYPSLSLSQLHRASMNEAEVESQSDMRCTCRYRSAGDPHICAEADLATEKIERQNINKGVTIKTENNSNNDSLEDGVNCGSDYDSDDIGDQEQTSCKKKRLLMVKFCESDCFKISIMTAIFLNTVTMAMEHHQQVNTFL